LNGDEEKEEHEKSRCFQQQLKKGQDETKDKLRKYMYTKEDGQLSSPIKGSMVSLPAMSR
jgi:hypothetical protein